MIARPASTGSPGAIIGQLFVVVATGVGVAFLIPRVPLLVTLVVLLGMIYGIVFLNRPDVGLMIVLLARASTDLSLRFMRPIFVERSYIAGLPNIGLIGILILAGGLFILRRSLPLITLPGGKLLALILLTGAVGALRSDSALLALNEWLPVVSSLIVYSLTAALFRSPQRMRRVIDVFAASFVLPALFGFYQLVSGTRFVLADEGVSRILGTFVHPNGFGLYLVVILSVFLVEALSQTGKRKLVALMIVLASTTLLVATFARASWVGAIIVLLTVGALRSRALLVVVAVIGVLALGLVPSIPARLTDPFGAGGSFADRVHLWRGTLQQWQIATTADASFFATGLNRLTGLGPGSVELLTLRVRGYPATAHNDYLRVLVEYGLFGLSLYVSLLVVLARFAYHSWRESSDRTGAGVALAFLALTLANPIMSITDHVFAQTAYQVYFWTLAGMTVAAGQLSRLAADGGSSLRYAAKTYVNPEGWKARPQDARSIR
jgi:O-antigen ligase